jgi:hypothetical protein
MFNSFSMHGQQSSHSGHGLSAVNETTHLLPACPEEEVDHDGCFPPHGVHDICPANPHAALPVYITIHRYESITRTEYVKGEVY